ncbi:hypothetical protein OF83DRAFT_518561 [Amylostereum chailletii]|nr:hypothetical protein OF83DRAFT_518561 [Amylostereum chailletii]
MSWTPSPTRPAFRDPSDGRRGNHLRSVTGPSGYPQSSSYSSPPLPLPPSLIPGHRPTYSSTSFVNNATVLFTHARPNYTYHPDAANLPPRKTEVLVPLTRTAPSTPPPPLPGKPPALRTAMSAPAPPTLPPKPFASSNEPPSFYNQAIPAAVTIPFPPLETLGPQPRPASPEAIDEPRGSDLTPPELFDQHREVRPPNSPGEEAARALEAFMRPTDSPSQQSSMLHPYSKPAESLASQTPRLSSPAPPAVPFTSSQSPLRTLSASALTSSPPSNIVPPRPLTPADVQNQVAEDEALARRLAAEDREAFEAESPLHLHPSTYSTPGRHLSCRHVLSMLHG